MTWQEVAVRPGQQVRFLVPALLLQPRARVGSSSDRDADVVVERRGLRCNVEAGIERLLRRKFSMFIVNADVKICSCINLTSSSLQIVVPQLFQCGWGSIFQSALDLLLFLNKFFRQVL